MAYAEVYDVTSVRTGITPDGMLELQLIYGNNRGSTLWLRLNRVQALKVGREVDALKDETMPPRSAPLRLAVGE